ncbi:MAG: YidH family protein [Hyphomicrobiaceae bacterium]
MSDLNDPRVFFAAERTLMAWNRTGLTLMAFGFVLERFGLFLHVLRQNPGHAGRDMSFWIGIAFISLALTVIGFSIVQYRRVLKTLKPIEIPERYCTWGGIAMNVSVVVLGFALLAYLFSEL